MLYHWLLRLGLSLSFAVLSFLSPLAHGAGSEKASDRKQAAQDGKEPVWLSHPGPWGHLEIRSTYLEAPDSLVEEMPKPGSVPRWSFPGATTNSLKQLFTKAGLSAEFQARLFDPDRVVNKDGALTVFPPLPELDAMTSDQRTIIYTELAKSPLNEFHNAPVVIIGGDVNDWLRQTHLPPEQQELIRQRLWRRGQALLFSDVRALLNLAHSDTEVWHIFKTMTRTRTLIAELKIPEVTDVKPLVEYWSGGGRSMDIVPILESATERESISSIDITHLLPPMMRRRLYTYPTAEPVTRGRMPDCHWTSLNFFKDAPQDYYLDTRLASSHVVENYVTVQPPYRFGDVLIVQSDKGEAIHSCVFIADDMVLTKNGENTLTPWVLMWLDDIRDIYIRGDNWRIQGYREKPSKTSLQARK